MEKAFRISVRELVAFCFPPEDITPGGGVGELLAGGVAHRAAQKQREGEIEKSLHHVFSLCGCTIELFGRMDAYTDGGVPLVEEMKHCRTTPAAPWPEHRAQALCYAAMVSLLWEKPQVAFCVSYVSLDGEVLARFEECLAAEELCAQVEAWLSGYLTFALREEVHREARNASLKQMAFPYPAYRSGQRELAKQVYTAISRKRRLFASLPTGTGKSAAVLFPALKAIGEGKRKKADRIFGAVLIAVTVVFLLVFVLLILIERPLLELVMAVNPNLIDMVIDYTVPLFATAVVFEVFLCIERAFRIDGRAKLFSKRAIVTNIANILLDILMVSVLGLGVSGLAWASVISSAIGYAVSLSHFLSKKRTVSPDLSVLSSPGELLSYVKSDIRLGSSATLDEVMSAVALAAQTAAIGAVGGPGGLAIWAVYKSLRGVVVAVGNGVSASVSVHAGLLFGQGDYDGVRYSVKMGVRIALMISFGAVLLVLLLASILIFRCLAPCACASAVRFSRPLPSWRS